MKIEDKTSNEDKQNRIIRIDIIAETWEENEQLAKGMGIEYSNTAECVELNLELRR